MKLSILIPSKEEEKIVQMIEETEREFPDAQIITANDRYGRGKGWAIRRALMHAEGDLIAFIDGDLDIKPRMLKRLIPYLEDYDVVVGVKPISGLWSRRILTFLSRYYIALFFNIKVNTQTGIKLFKREAIQEWYSNQWLFDLEILSLAKQKGFRMIEVPIEANVSKKMKFHSIWETLKQSITLWIELRG